MGKSMVSYRFSLFCQLIARCKMPFQNGLGRWMATPAPDPDQWFWFEATRGFDTFPVLIPHLRTPRQPWRCSLMRFRCNWCWGRWGFRCHDPVFVDSWGCLESSSRLIRCYFWLPPAKASPIWWSNTRDAFHMKWYECMFPIIPISSLVFIWI